MPRRRTKLELSLFPFLNILFSLIAVLILYIFFIVQKDAVEGSAIGQARGGDERLSRQISEHSRRLREQLDDVERQLRQAADVLGQRRLLLELRKSQDTEPAAGRGTSGVPIGAPVPKEWRMLPAREGDNLKSPVLVVVGAESYVVHDFGGKSHSTTKLPAIPAPPRTKPGDPEPPRQADPKLKAFLDGFDRTRRGRSYLLFLIRPEGIGAFDQIKIYCDEHYMTPLSQVARKRKPTPSQTFDYGYEPFSDRWLLVGEAAKP
jgi:hypothetical protein